MKHKLELVFDDQTGHLALAGPLQNKLLCYGMLELAKEAMGNKEFKPTSLPSVEEKEIEVVPAGTMQ